MVLADFTELNTWAANALTLIQYIAVALAALMIAVAGIVTITGMGSAEKRELARNIIIGVAVGLLLVFIATRGAQFLIGLNSYNPAAHPPTNSTP